MDTVTVRDLRNHSASVLDRVAHGERLVVTKDGDPVAFVSPAPARPRHISEIQRQAATLPPVDAVRLRADVDDIFDQSL